MERSRKQGINELTLIHFDGWIPQTEGRRWRRKRRKRRKRRLL